jgi:acylphosphatase
MRAFNTLCIAAVSCTLVTIASPLAQLNAKAQSVTAVSGIVTGNVQEVGFRAMIQRRAIRYNLAGSVENKNDKSVQFFLQGDEDRIDKTLNAIRKGTKKSSDVSVSVSPQSFVANPLDKDALEVDQDIKQVWFAGVHADIGGGYAKEESGLSKFPLNWMIDEAVKYGLDINPRTRNHLALGQNDAGAREIFVKPDAQAILHVSLTAAWRPLELIPKRVKYQEWKRRLKLDGFYIPCGEPRPFKLIDPYTHAEIEETVPRVHHSVFDRMDMMSDYRPMNLLPEHIVEPWPHQKLK